ncbi:MAG: PD-(D/E)XK nuclease family protein [Myxococcales bacterium]|nr:PD-(D/E)XK nuclease family protein [Myxococcales bacterium]
MTESSRNPHLSFSRLSRYEQCPRSYYLHYRDKLPAEPGMPLRFGTVLHAALEALLKEAIDEQLVGPLSVERALAFYQAAWLAEGLSGLELFEQGLHICRAFVRVQGVLDWRHVLAVEQDFRLQVGEFTVVGCIDRVDKLDDESIEIIDYKSNYQLFSREEVDSSLQLALYQAAAQTLWPWAKNIRLSYWLLRHDLRQVTVRTGQQISDALTYVEMLGRQIEAAASFPPQVSANCAYCDHRHHCDAYAQALTGARSVVCADLTNLVELAREREEVASLSRVLYARKQELEEVLKAHLQDKEQLELGGVRYRLLPTSTVEYPIEPTLSLLADATGAPKEQLATKLLAIDKKAFDQVLAEVGKQLPRARVALLKAEIDAHASTRYSTRFWAKGMA